MIINRYIQRSIHLGTLGALLLLVSLSLFFIFVKQIDNLGKGDYGLLQALEFIALSIPGEIVEFMPLAVLLGSILGLGALAGNSEIIAMQASGVSQNRMLAAVLQAALVLALVSFLLGDWIVPDSETAAGRLKSLGRKDTTALQSGEGLWIKDGSRVVHVQALLPNGFARDIEIYQLDPKGKVLSTLRAAYAVPMDKGWELQQVSQSIISLQNVVTRRFERLLYEGSLSRELLQVLMIEPRKMSSMDLYAYLNFLDQNRLDSRQERLIFWKKLLTPFTIVIMCLLAFPFVLGSQRQSSGGQRLMTGILLGLAFVVIERLLTQLGIQLAINPLVVALLPNLLFFFLAIFLLLKKQSHGIAIGLFAGGQK